MGLNKEGSVWGSQRYPTWVPARASLTLLRGAESLGGAVWPLSGRKNFFLIFILFFSNRE